MLIKEIIYKILMLVINNLLERGSNRNDDDTTLCNSWFGYKFIITSNGNFLKSLE